MGSEATATETTEATNLLGGSAEATPATAAEPPAPPAATEPPAPATAVEPPAAPEPPGNLLGSDPAQDAKPATTEDDLKISLPEGYEADEALMGSLKEAAKKAGIQQGTLQELVDLHIASQQRAQEAAQAAWAETQKGWITQVKNDPVLGGANFQKNLALANRALEKYGTPELTQELRDTGLSNHPGIVRFVMRVGQALGEDSIAGASAAPAQQPQGDPWHNLYGKNSKKE